MRRLLFMIFYAPVCFLCACSFGQSDKNTNVEAGGNTDSPDAIYRKITPEEAKAIMDGGEDYILLDVRTDEEFQKRRIKGATLIPDNEIGKRAQNELSDKDALILVYCRSGRRSALAAKKLVEMGYTNVFDFGGIDDWPYETVTGKA